MEKRKLLSVVVPTKDRYKYLKYLIDLIASFKSDEIELVIQDNSDDNTEFVSYLEGLNYDFIRYNHIKGQIPMAINSDKAILNSTGEYVCFLGDDDGLTRYTLDCARWMKSNNIEAVKSSTVNYYWPDITQGSQKAPSAVVRYQSFTGSVKYILAKDELLRVLHNGIQNRGNMPLVYHSIVHRVVLDTIYEKVGTFFPGNSPDISNAVALSLVVEKFVYVDIPLAFSGWSVFHGGGVHATGKKGHPEINEIPWFRPEAEEKWDKKVPRIAAGSMIWADSAINALKSMGATNLYHEINFNKMYACFLLNNPQYKDRVDAVCENKGVFKFYYFKEFVQKYVNALFRRIGWRLGFIRVPVIEKNIDNILKASALLDEKGHKFINIFQN